MRSSKLIILFVLLLIFNFAMAASTEAQQKKPLSMATATIGGAYYPMGQAMCSVINKYVSNISITPEVTNGAAENVRLVGTGNTDFGITNANVIYWAYNGQKAYKKRIDNLAAIGNIHPSVLHIVTLAGSDIKKFTDLKGKKVAVGPPGQGTIIVLRTMFDEYGMSVDDIRANYLPYTDGFSQLGDRNLDAAIALGGYPMAAIVEISSTQAIRLIVLEDDKMEALLNKYPYYSKIVIPKNAYKQAMNIPVIGIRNVFFTKKEMDEKLVYDVTKALYEHLDELGAMNATARQIDKETLSKVPIPLHPGAKKYYDEKNMR